MKCLAAIAIIVLLTISAGLTALLATELNTISNYGDCQFSIKYDLNQLHPLLLQSTRSDFYLPENAKGDITLKSGDVIWLSCPGGSVFIHGKSTGKAEISVKCVSNKWFETSSRDQVQIDGFICDRINSVARNNGKSCLGNYRQIDVGFQQSDGNFIQQLNICFDGISQTTAYTVSKIIPSIIATQLNSSRPMFEEGNFFDLGKFKLQTLYTKKVHRITILNQLDLPSTSNKYFENNFLTRGHLAPNSDNVYHAQKNATFYFVNAAPQWQSFNAGNWEKVESNVRYYVMKNRRNLIVYTGTHDVATLPNNSGDETPLYLYITREKRGIPVPKFYWKIVHEPQKNAGVAFIGLNNPFVDNTNIGKNILCQDVCQQISWVSMPTRTNITEGYTYCCSVNDAQKIIPNIPKLRISKLLV